jgi:hypothetical protein
LDDEVDMTSFVSWTEPSRFKTVERQDTRDLCVCVDHPIFAATTLTQSQMQTADLLEIITTDAPFQTQQPLQVLYNSIQFHTIPQPNPCQPLQYDHICQSLIFALPVTKPQKGKSPWLSQRQLKGNWKDVVFFKKEKHIEAPM